MSASATHVRPGAQLAHTRSCQDLAVPARPCSTPSACPLLCCQKASRTCLCVLLKVCAGLVGLAVGCLKWVEALPARASQTYVPAPQCPLTVQFTPSTTSPGSVCLGGQVLGNISSRPSAAACWSMAGQLTCCRGKAVANPALQHLSLQSCWPDLQGHRWRLAGRGARRRGSAQC